MRKITLLIVCVFNIFYSLIFYSEGDCNKQNNTNYTKKLYIYIKIDSNVFKSETYTETNQKLIFVVSFKY